MGNRMGYGGCFSEFCECSQNSRSRFAVHSPLGFLTTKYHDVLIIVWGWGALAKAKEGQREEFKVKRESLPTSTSGGIIPSQHSRTCTYLYRLRQGGSYTKWPLMSYLNKKNFVLWSKH